MQARSKFHTKIAIAAMISAAALVGCGGGDEEVSDMHVVELREHSVSPVGSATVRVGTRLPIDSYTETIGASIESIEWSVDPQGRAKGDVVVDDPQCDKGEKTKRPIAGSEKESHRWSCKTFVLAEPGAEGDFRVSARAYLDTGAVKAADFILTVTR